MTVSISMFVAFCFGYVCERVCVCVCVQTERPTNAPHSLQSLHCTAGRDSSIFNMFLSIIHTPNLSALLCEGLVIGWDIFLLTRSHSFLSLFLFASLLCLFLFVLMFSVHPRCLQQLHCFFFISSCYGARRLLNPSTIQIAWLRESIRYPVRSAQQPSATTSSRHVQHTYSLLKGLKAASHKWVYMEDTLIM